MTDQDQQHTGQPAHEPMTAARLAEIRARLEAATPGPWYVGAGEFVQQERSYMAICRVNNPVVNDVLRGVTVDGGRGSNEPNKWFIAHAPSDIADLLAFAEAALPILRAVAACEAVRAPTFGLGGIEGIVLHHDSLNVLWMREQARALLAGAGEVSADEGSES